MLVVYTNGSMVRKEIILTFYIDTPTHSGENLDTTFLYIVEQNPTLLNKLPKIAYLHIFTSGHCHEWTRSSQVPPCQVNCQSYPIPAPHSWHLRPLKMSSVHSMVPTAPLSWPLVLSLCSSFVSFHSSTTPCTNSKFIGLQFLAFYTTGF